MNGNHPIKIAVVLTSALFFSSVAHAKSEQCQQADDATIAGLFDRWNGSLKTLDAERVTANYTEDAVLLATVANTPRTNHEQIKHYFEGLLKKQPTGVIDSRIIRVDCNTAFDIGTYTFTFKDGKQLPARYTFIYEYRDGKWLIAHQHSSAMAEVKATN